MKLPEMFRRLQGTGGNGNESLIKNLPMAERIHYNFDKTDGVWQFNKQYSKADIDSLKKKEIEFINDDSVIDALEALELPCKARKLDEEKWEAVIYINDNQFNTFYGFVAATHGIEHVDEEPKEQKGAEAA